MRINKRKELMKKDSNDIKPEFICDKCNYPMYSIHEVGYMGNPHEKGNPREKNFECSPFTELMTLCKKCTAVDYLTNPDQKP